MESFGSESNSQTEFELILSEDGADQIGAAFLDGDAVVVAAGADSASGTCDTTTPPVVLDESGNPKFYAVVTDGQLKLVPIGENDAVITETARGMETVGGSEQCGSGVVGRQKITSYDAVRDEEIGRGRVLNVEEPGAAKSEVLDVPRVVPDNGILVGNRGGGQVQRINHGNVNPDKVNYVKNRSLTKFNYWRSLVLREHDYSHRDDSSPEMFEVTDAALLEASLTMGEELGDTTMTTSAIEPNGGDTFVQTQDLPATIYQTENDDAEAYIMLADEDCLGDKR